MLQHGMSGASLLATAFDGATFATSAACRNANCSFEGRHPIAISYTRGPLGALLDAAHKLDTCETLAWREASVISLTLEGVEQTVTRKRDSSKDARLRWVHPWQ